jgi:hypothetical protein
MSYNKYRWWTKGRVNKPLKEDAPLLLKIRNGDFDYSYMFGEARDTRQTAKLASENAYKNYRGTDDKNRNEVAMEAGRMKRIKAIKLELEAFANENKILWKLQNEFRDEFGKLWVDSWWDRGLELKKVKTIEDLYFWFKNKCKEKTTKSEMDILFKRANTKGLEHLF